MVLRSDRRGTRQTSRPSRPLLVGLNRSAKYKRWRPDAAGPSKRLDKAMILPRRQRQLLLDARAAPVDRCNDCSGASAESEQHAPVRLRRKAVDGMRFAHLRRTARLLDDDAGTEENRGNPRDRFRRSPQSAFASASRTILARRNAQRRAVRAAARQLPTRPKRSLALPCTETSARSRRRTTLACIASEGTRDDAMSSRYPSFSAISLAKSAVPNCPCRSRVRVLGLCSASSMARSIAAAALVSAVEL